MPDSKSTPAASQAVASASGPVGEPRPKKLLDQVRDAIRPKHYSLRTDLRELCSLDQALHPEPATDASQSGAQNPKS
jgi:hypothetical protein